MSPGPLPAHRGSPVAMGFGVPWPQLPGDVPLPDPVPGQRRVPAGGIGCPRTPWPQCPPPPSWGHLGQNDQVREGHRDTFSLSLAPRCHHRRPKIAGSSCSASSCGTASERDPLASCPWGGDRHQTPRDGCPPAPAGTPRRTRLPRERRTIYSLDKSPGSQSPRSHPPAWPWSGQRGQGLSHVPPPS